MNIICFSNIDWGFIAQRHHHLMKCLKKSDSINEVIFVETLGTRNIKLNKEDIKRGINKLFLKYKNIKSESLDLEGIRLLKPNFMPFFNRIAFEVNEILLRKQLEQTMIELGIKSEETVAWVMLPHPVISKLVDKFNFKKIIYDCIDDVKSFPDVKELIVKTEVELISKADLVTTTSDKLYNYANKYNSEVKILKNAVSESIIIKENKIERKKTKVIGYVGTVYEWFDIRKIEILAEQRPDYEIRIYGPIRIDITRLQKYENVKLYGVIPYQKVEKVIEEFDVCIIPFEVNDLTLNTNPVKLYEYLAKGKPVVSVKLPELEVYRDIVYLYNNDIEFIEYIDKAINEDKLLEENRINVAMDNTWEKRADEILKIL